MKSTIVNTHEIGKRIRQKRKSMYMTSADINAHVSIASATLSEIECGHKAPSCLTLLKLSEVLECTTDYILKGVEANPTPAEENRLTTREQELISHYRILSEVDKTEIDEYIKVKLRIKKALTLQFEMSEKES